MTREDRGHGLVIFLVGLIQLIITTDFSLVAVTLPSIGRDLHIPPASLSWIVSAAALTGGGFLILAGRAADIYGQRSCLLLGLALFAGGSVCAALSPNLTVLIAARALQGLGGAILAPANFSLINTLLPEGEPRRRALGVFGIMQGLSLVIGLLLGGSIATHVGWRAVFLMNPVIAVLAIAIALKAAPGRRAGAAGPGTIDWLGAILIVAGMGFSLSGIAAMGKEGLTAGRPLILLAAGLIGFALFFVVEGRVRAPLAPLSMFGRRNFTTACLIMMLHLAGVGAVFVLLSLYMQTGLKMTAMQSGLGMMPYAAAVMLSGQLAPPIMARVSHRLIVFGAFGLYALGVTLFVLFSREPNYWLSIALGSMVTGFGGTLAFMALMADATADIPTEQQGAASAVLFTTHQIGIPLGATIALSVLGFSVGAGLGAFQFAYFAAAGLVVAGWLIALVTLRPTPPIEPALMIPDGVV